jgi:hypothetical protein
VTGALAGLVAGALLAVLTVVRRRRTVRARLQQALEAERAVHADLPADSPMRAAVATRIRLFEGVLAGTALVPRMRRRVVGFLVLYLVAALLLGVVAVVYVLAGPVPLAAVAGFLCGFAVVLAGNDARVLLRMRRAVETVDVAAAFEDARSRRRPDAE